MTQLIKNYRTNDPSLKKFVKPNNQSSLPLTQSLPENLAMPAKNFQDYYLQSLNATACSSFPQVDRNQFENSVSLKRAMKNLREEFQNRQQSLLAFKPISIKFEPQEIQCYNEIQELSLIKRETCSSSSELSRNQPIALNMSQMEQNGVSKKKSGRCSKYKNCYGLITGRVIKTTKEYLLLIRRYQLKQMNLDPRFYYIHQRIWHLNNDPRSLESFLEKYHTRSEDLKNRKGRATVYDYLAGDVENGLILVELIKDFLDSENEDLKDYIKKGIKCRKCIAEVLVDEESLTYLYSMFDEMRINLQELSGLKLEKVEI